MKKCVISFTNWVGKPTRVEFEEVESHCSKYGNQKAINIKLFIEDKEQPLMEYIDCRYIINYDFTKTCILWVDDKWETKKNMKVVSTWEEE